MNVRSINLVKEARLLLSAWVVVMLAGVLSLVPVNSTVGGLNVHGMLESLVPFGAMFGIPLLATLAFGSEFQYRTMSMLLAQPRDRREIWRAKMAVSIAAVATTAVVYAFALHALRGKRPEEWLSVIAIAVVTLAAAPFFTFVARSMIGGLALNLSGFFVVTLTLDYLGYLAQTSPHNGYGAYDRHLRDLPGWFLVAAVLVYAGYAVVMAWLGHRSLLRLQAVEGMQAGEAVLPGARLFPQFVANWFRCRPRQRLLNLLRREFHLLRIVWALGVLCAAMWAAIALFGMMPTPESDRFIMIVAIAAVANVVVAVLAGAISLGEEKTWGTHSWHMTLPISPSVQWMVKLVAALSTSSVCAVLIPIAILKIGGSIGGPAHGLVGHADLWEMVLYAALLTLAAFLSSCIVKGTVRAIVWVVPIGLAVVGSALVATWFGDLGSDRAGSAFMTSWYSRAVGWVVAAIGPMKVSKVTNMLTDYLFGQDMKYFLFTVVIGVVLIQTHRAFAAKREETTRTAVRALVPAIVATLLCALTLEGMQFTFVQSYRQEDRLLAEMHEAIVTGVRTTDGKVQRLTWDELSRDAALSSGARKWLHNASITVMPDSPELTRSAESHLGRMAPSTLWSVVPRDQAGPVAGYLAIVHLADGSECSLKYNRARSSQSKYFGGWIRGTCN